MGYRGKIEERQRARELRAESWTLADIAVELGVAKSSVSLWVRDVDFEPQPRRRGRSSRPTKAQFAKAEELRRLNAEGIERIGTLSDREFLMAGLGLYAGDGAKTGGAVRFSNSNPLLIEFFCAWFRRFFDIDEAGLRVRLYLHEDLDLGRAEVFWGEITGIPASQFHKPFRPVARETSRGNRHEYGCCHVIYSSTTEIRRILGLVSAMMLIPSNSGNPG